ncbi:MAG: hypothetical protein K8S99_05950 [Planctomycetes bacterium]|nr:hypothetical protein [Planctomycetota bacterium]
MDGTRDDQQQEVTVAQAKARLRHAAEQCTLPRLIAESPWRSVLAASSLGLIATKFPFLRRLAFKGLLWGGRWLFVRISQGSSPT